MRDKLVLRFLGFLETIKYILEQSHGVPPVSVALNHTTLKEEGSCGYSSVKTVRSIGEYKDNKIILQVSADQKLHDYCQSNLSITDIQATLVKYEDSGVLYKYK